MESRANLSSFGLENLPYRHYLVKVGHGMPMDHSEILRDGLGLCFGEEQCEFLWRALISGCICGMTEGFRSGEIRADYCVAFHVVEKSDGTAKIIFLVMNRTIQE
jgi:hypothetical protein